MVNPRIVAQEGSQIDEEGCLSIPELTAKVKRFKKITVSYQDLEGKGQELTTENRFAVVLQHEIDHLNGILFIDHLSSLKRNLYKKKVKKLLEHS
jgi:peptide deformylase